MLYTNSKQQEVLAKVTSEDMSIYEGLEDYNEEEANKEETMSNSWKDALQKTA